MDPLLDDYRDYLAHVRRFSPHTVRAYLQDVRAIWVSLTALGAGLPLTWRPEQLRQALQDKAHRCLGGRSLSRRHSAMRTFLRWLSEQPGMATLEDLAAHLVAPRLPRPLPRGPAEEVALAIMAAPLTGPNVGRDRALLLLLYGLGLRRHETTSLLDAHVDLATGEAQVRGKGQHLRALPIPLGCLPGLRLYWVNRGPSVTFIAGRRGAPLSDSTVARVVARTTLLVGSERLTPHQLRHAYATHLLQRGANLREIQTLLGHQRLVTTQRYTEVATRQLVDIYDRAHPRARRRD